MNRIRKNLVNFLETALSTKTAEQIKAEQTPNLTGKERAAFDRSVAQAQRRRAYKNAQRQEAELRK